MATGTGTPDRSVDAELDVGDVQIGAVELKDGTTDNRQTVSSDGRAAVYLPAKVIVATEFTRPADTTTYAAFDVVGPAVTANLTFADVARVNGGSGYIVGFKVVTSDVAATLAKRYRLNLFHTAPTAIADNAPYTHLYADRAKMVGYLDSDGATTDGAGSTAYRAPNIVDRLPFVAAAADNDLFGILEILDGYQPGNAQTFRVEIAVERD